MKTNKITIIEKDGTQYTIMIPTGASSVIIEAEGLKVDTVIPRESTAGYINGDVSVTVTANETKGIRLPEVSLAVGEKDDVGFKWLTAARMVVTDNGRIVGQNATLGYASTSKPLATMPWVRKLV